MSVAVGDGGGVGMGVAVDDEKVVPHDVEALATQSDGQTRGQVAAGIPSY